MKLIKAALLLLFFSVTPLFGMVPDQGLNSIPEHNKKQSISNSEAKNFNMLFRLVPLGTVRERFIGADTFYLSHKSGLFLLQAYDFVRDFGIQKTTHIGNVYLGGPLGEWSRNTPFGYVFRIELVSGFKPIIGITPQITLENFNTSLGRYLKRKKIELFFQSYYKSSNNVGRYEFFHRYAFPIYGKISARGFIHYYIFSPQTMAQKNILAGGIDLFYHIDKTYDLFWRISYGSRAFEPISFGGWDTGFGLRINFTN